MVYESDVGRARDRNAPSSGRYANVRDSLVTSIKNRDDDRRRKRSRSRERNRSRSRERQSSSRYSSAPRRDQRQSSSRYDAPPPPREVDSEARRTSAPSKDLVPLHLRQVKLENWDLPPPGYEGMSVDMVKATGHFPLPGQPNRSAPTTLTYIHHNFKEGFESETNLPAALNPNFAKHTKRLHVGGLPENLDENIIMEFFNTTMAKLNFSTNDASCVSVKMSEEAGFAYVEFSSIEEATSAIALDGITYKDATLSIKRPKDYEFAAPNQFLPGGIVSSNVQDSPNKIFVGGIPNSLTEDQVMELLKAFGDLRAFNLIKDIRTGESKGFAFCEYVDTSLTDIVCEGLNGMELADKKLIVQRAAARDGTSMLPAGMIEGVGDILAITEAPVDSGSQSEPSSVLLLMNLLDLTLIEDDGILGSIKLDISTECSRFGEVSGVEIPRCKDGSSVHSAGKVYVKYASKDDCGIALRALAGRKFDGHVVITSFYSEESFDNKTFN